MTYIHIRITINEEAIRAKAIQLYHAAKEHAKTHYGEAFAIAHTIGTRHASTTILGRILAILIEKRRTSLPDHTIACECNRRGCPGRTLAITTYVRKIKAL